MMAQLKNQRKKLRSRKHHDATYRAKKLGLRIAHHKHTGRRLPFYCTSYAVLFFLLVFVSSIVLFVSYSAKADQQTGTIQLGGVVSGKPPEIPAKITSPSNGSHFTESQIEVSGTCLQDNYVEIYRKDIFAGMTKCSPEGTFTITITLVPGENRVVAKTRDSLGQYGPDSEAVTYFLDAKPGTKQSNNTGLYKPLLIYTDPVQKGVLMGQSLKINYEIDGNEGPYTIVIDWGDGSPITLVKHDKEGDYSASHIYKEPGQRTVRISGIGSQGGKASIQTIIVVHSESAPITSTASSCDSTTFAKYCFSSDRITVIIDFLWPAIIIAMLMTASFWVGEKISYEHLRPRPKS
ncbi:MAG: hypothetical protein AAB423_04175 [Patescibacteria group bacterium]|mgnify:CR=1 FL=1